MEQNKSSNPAANACSLDCEHEFQLCMMYALDGFLIGACSETLEDCENQCPKSQPFQKSTLSSNNR